MRKVDLLQQLQSLDARIDTARTAVVRLEGEVADAGTLADPTLRARLGIAARARASEFGWTSVAARMIDLYWDLIHAEALDRSPALSRS